MTLLRLFLDPLVGTAAKLGPVLIRHRLGRPAIEPFEEQLLQPAGGLALRVLADEMADVLLKLDYIQHELANGQPVN